MARKQKKDYEERSSDDEEIGEEDGPPTINPYEVLGLEQEATADDVKKAYRKMALKHHPGSHESISLLTHAHVLQTRPPRVTTKLPIRSSRRSHSHTLSSQTTADASATTSLEALPNHSKMTRTSTGSASTADSSKTSSMKRLLIRFRMSTRVARRSEGT